MPLCKKEVAKIAQSLRKPSPELAATKVEEENILKRGFSELRATKVKEENVLKQDSPELRASKVGREKVVFSRRKRADSPVDRALKRKGKYLKKARETKKKWFRRVLEYMLPPRIGRF